MVYLIDTNIVIYYFNGLTDDEAIHTILAESFKISIITKIEFLGWGQFATDLESHTKAREFISHATETLKPWCLEFIHGKSSK